MDYLFLTDEGFSIEIIGGPEPEALQKQLNNRELIVLPLGGNVVSKHVIKMALPKGELGDSHELHTSEGMIYLIDIEDYNEKSIAESINDRFNDYVLVGDIVVAKHKIKMVRPSKVPEEVG